MGKMSTFRSSLGEARSMQQQDAPGAYTTVVVHHGGAEVRGFGYAWGHNVPGTTVPATRRDTNMMSPNQFVDGGEGPWIGMEMAIPAITPPEFRTDPSLGPYRVTEQDVIDFARRAFVRLFLSREKPFFEYAPDRSHMQWSMVGAIQRVPFPISVQPRLVDKFWLEVGYPRGAPTFADPNASLAVVFRMLTDSEKPWIQYGKWAGPKDAKTKAYVVVGKEGLDELLAELLGVTPSGLKGEDE